MKNIKLVNCRGCHTNKYCERVREHHHNHENIDKLYELMDICPCGSCLVKVTCNQTCAKFTMNADLQKLQITLLDVNMDEATYESSK